MALVALCQAGNFVHVYDFRVKPGRGEEFIRLFDSFDYSDANPMHKSKAQAKDGVLCRDTNVHAEILVQLAAMKPEFVGLIEGGPAKFKPIYAEVVSSTPQHLLDKASAAE